MELPALTSAKDMQFLREVTATCIDAFWANYLSLQTPESQAEYEDACEKEDTDRIIAWMTAHANFKADANAEAQGAKILEEIAAKLPEAMKADYADLHSSQL